MFPVRATKERRGEEKHQTRRRENCRKQQLAAPQVFPALGGEELSDQLASFSCDLVKCGYKNKKQQKPEISGDWGGRRTAPPRYTVEEKFTRVLHFSATTRPYA